MIDHEALKAAHPQFRLGYGQGLQDGRDEAWQEVSALKAKLAAAYAVLRNFEIRKSDAVKVHKTTSEHRVAHQEIMALLPSAV